jgi:hypothetical protein
VVAAGGAVAGGVGAGTTGFFFAQAPALNAAIIRTAAHACNLRLIEIFSSSPA